MTGDQQQLLIEDCIPGNKITCRLILIGENPADIAISKEVGTKTIRETLNMVDSKVSGLIFDIAEMPIGIFTNYTFN